MVGHLVFVHSSDAQRILGNHCQPPVRDADHPEGQRRSPSREAGVLPFLVSLRRDSIGEGNLIGPDKNFHILLQSVVRKIPGIYLPLCC